MCILKRFAAHYNIRICITPQCNTSEKDIAAVGVDWDGMDMCWFGG